MIVQKFQKMLFFVNCFFFFVTCIYIFFHVCIFSFFFFFFFFKYLLALHTVPEFGCNTLSVKKIHLFLSH